MIEGVAQSNGLFIGSEVIDHNEYVLTFTDAYMNEIGEIRALYASNFCGCGRSAVTLHSPIDTAWLLWARA